MLPTRCSNYLLLHHLSQGCFGQVVQGQHVRTGGAVAIKLERVDTASPTLKHECNILYYLSEERGCRNVPTIEWWGTFCLEEKEYRALVLPLYDMTLADVPTTTMTRSATHWIQDIIRILYHVHEAGIVHRDIKPQNFMLRRNVLYLIDFGLSSVYVDAEHRAHLPPRHNNQDHMIGTPKYVSIHVHAGNDPSRRDDVISVGYLWLFLSLGGRLPWDEREIQKCSTKTTTYNLCHILHPANQARLRLKQQYAVSSKAMEEYFQTVYSLEFEEMPPYTHLLSIVAQEQELR